MMKTEEPYKLCLMGCSLGTQNMGVSALAASVVSLVLDTKPNTRISLLIGNRSDRPQEFVLRDRTLEVEVVNYRLSPRARLHEHLFWILTLACLVRILPAGRIRDRIVRSNRWLRTLHEAHLVSDIRGGDSFSDIYGLRRFFLGSLPAITAVLLGKRLVFLPQTYGPYRSRFTRIVARALLTHADQILSRDRQGSEVVSGLLGGQAARQARFCPDVAFTLEAFEPKFVEIHPPLPQDRAPLIGVNVNGLMYSGGYTRDNMFGLRFDYRDFVRNLISRT